MKLMQSEEITLYLLTAGCNTSADAVLESDEIFRKLQATMEFESLKTAY